MKIDKKYFDIINDTDCWTAIQLAESFAVETSIGESKIDLSEPGYVTVEEITPVVLGESEFTYYENGEEKVIKIMPSLDISKMIYQMILDKVIKAEDYISIAKSIFENQKDQDWAVKICKVAIEKSCTIWDYDKSICLLSDLLFPNVFCEENKKWQRFQNVTEAEKGLFEEVLSKAKKVSVETEHFLRLSQLVVRLDIEEIFPDTLKPLLELASRKVRTVSDIVEIAYFYLTWIKKDKEEALKKADEYFKKAADLCLDSEDYRSIVEKLCEARNNDDEMAKYINLNYQDWMKELFNKASKKTFQSYERENLIYNSSDEYGLNDTQYSELLKKEMVTHPLLTHENKLTQETKDRLKECDSRYEVTSLSNELFENDKKAESRELLRIFELSCFRPEDLISLGNHISDENYLSDKKWATEVYKKALQIATKTSDILSTSFATVIANEYGQFKDKKWAKEILLLGLDLCVTFDDYNRLSGEIFLALDDTKWALEVLSIGEKYARTSFDFKELGAQYSGGYNMDPVDIEKARNFFKIAVSKIQDTTDLYEITRHVCQDLKDKEWAKKLFKEQLESSKGFSRPTSDTFVNIAAFAYMDLNDRKLAKEIYIQAIDESKHDSEQIDYIIGEVEAEWGYNDKVLAQKLKKKYKK